MAVDVAQVYTNKHYHDEDDFYDDYEGDAMDSRIGDGKKLKRLPIDQTLSRDASSRFESSSRVNRVGDSTVEGISKGVRVKVNKIFDGSYGSTKFPRIEECSHFHYDQVNLGEEFWAEIVDAELIDEENDVFATFIVKVTGSCSSWMVTRTYEDFQGLDRQLHRCVFDRRFSGLPALKAETAKSQRLHGYIEEKRLQLSEYLMRLCSTSSGTISCGPILNWFEIDCKGRQLQPTSKSGINIPAVAAARVIKSFSAQEPDEVSLVVNEIVSIIDMPPESETLWWRGKAGFKVGFFPSYCVQVIQTSAPQRENIVGSLKSAGSSNRKSMASDKNSVKPVLAKRGKMLSRLRSVLRMRPSKEELQQSGILKARIFGADLSEHLQDANLDVPVVVKVCTELLERRGLVEGIYRLPGISSNINKLRLDFDANKVPNVEAPQYLNDINSIGSLCKMYFRELPNPLLTFQLYSALEEACKVEDEGSKLREAIAKVLGQLPPKHFSTLEHLIKHLAMMASHSDETKMTSRNLAIVWAPNLMKPRDTGGSILGLFNIAAPSIVVKSLIDHMDWYFGDTGISVMRKGAAAAATRTRSSITQPKSNSRHQIVSTFEPARPPMTAHSDAERRSKTTDDLAMKQQRKPPNLTSSYGGKSLRSLFGRKGGKSYNVSNRPVISGPVGFVGAVPAAAADAKEIVQRDGGSSKSQTLPASANKSVDLAAVGRRHTRLVAAFSGAFSRGSVVLEKSLPSDVSLDDTPGSYRTLEGRGSLGSETGSESGGSLASPPGITMIDSPEVAPRSESMFELGHLTERESTDELDSKGLVMSTDIDSYIAAKYGGQKVFNEEEEEDVEFSEL